MQGAVLQDRERSRKDGMPAKVALSVHHFLLHSSYNNTDYLQNKLDFGCGALLRTTTRVEYYYVLYTTKLRTLSS